MDTVVFFARGSHRCIKQDNCMLNDVAFKTIIHVVEDFIKKFGISCYNEQTGQGLLRHLCIRKAPSTGQILVCFVLNGTDIPHKIQLIDALTKNVDIQSIYINVNTKNTNVIYGAKCILLWGQESITDNLCGLDFKIAPLSFYQINSPQTENIYSFINDIVEPRSEDIVLDLYCGIGTIGLTMAKKVKRVIGIEVVEQAVSNATENALNNNIKNAAFYKTSANDAGNILSTLTKDNNPSIIIVDPPRKGLDEKTLNLIHTISPAKFIYISCNPITAARDIENLTTSSDYETNLIQPFDMFPRTSHIESVIMMTKH